MHDYSAIIEHLGTLYADTVDSDDIIGGGASAWVPTNAYTDDAVAQDIIASATALVVHQYLAITDLHMSTRDNGEVELSWAVALVHPHRQTPSAGS